MNYLMSILLTGGVICLSYGVNQDNGIMLIIGAISLGAYNGIYYNKVWRK